MFEIRANISGSQSQKEYNEYLHTMRQFGMRNAQLLEQQINAFKADKTSLVDSLNAASEKNNGDLARGGTVRRGVGHAR